VNDPVLTVNVIDVATLAVVAKDEVSAYDAEIANDEDAAQLLVPNVEPLCVPIKEPVKEPVLTAKVIDVAAEAVVAKDELIALLAQLAVPNVEPLWVPINDPVNEPVLTLNVIDVAADAVVANEDVNA
jgi:hypothetical protein